jgi:hypothetical protein
MSIVTSMLDVARRSATTTVPGRTALFVLNNSVHLIGVCATFVEELLTVGSIAGSAGPDDENGRLRASRPPSSSLC